MVEELQGQIFERILKVVRVVEYRILKLKERDKPLLLQKDIGLGGVRGVTEILGDSTSFSNSRGSWECTIFFFFFNYYTLFTNVIDTEFHRTHNKQVVGNETPRRRLTQSLSYGRREDTRRYIVSPVFGH